MKHPQSKPQSSFDVDRFIERAATAATDKPKSRRRPQKEATPRAKVAKPETAMPQEAVIEDEEKRVSEASRVPMAPVVVDLGKVKRKQVRKLKRGAGPLLEEVHDVVASVHHQLGDEAAGRALVPVVLLYERKPKKKRSWLAF